MKQTAHIGLGSNVGDREATLRKAITMLEQEDGIKVVCVSKLLETRPEGGAGGKYLNGVAEIETTLSPEYLLPALQRIEKALGRDRRKERRWGSRTCDLDILLMGEVVVRTDELTIPHPRLAERFFVLRPLTEIAPDVVHPVSGKTSAQLLAELESEL